jgi:hypothetical protein
MNRAYYEEKASEDFNRARTREMLTRILHILNPEDQELLSLADVRMLLKPRGESYRGMKVVPISRIVGSEGRYRDFNKWFLPKFDNLKSRWTRVDRAHLEAIILPPIKLFEIGGVYFVRDGNHRVSVAKAQGMEMIDAEVISLSSQIKLEPGMTKEDLREKVIEYERDQFMKATQFDRIIRDDSLVFTATGRYDEILNHIQGHKYYINERQKEEIPFRDAMISWYRNVYKPITDVIREDRILSRFPGRTCADLYVWVVKHWDELKHKYGHTFTMQDAARDFSKRYGKSLWQRLKEVAGTAFGIFLRKR